ncbi:hypothetical protein HDU93_008368 [Gonapodya sp. JEL0774]|nr:hypothetical protein HDU93_008368 [Gonapodya sp. JEL0774]
MATTTVPQIVLRDILAAGKPTLDAATLWSKRPALIVVALDLASQSSVIEKYADMYAVVHQEFGARDFAENYWKKPLYVRSAPQA